MDSQVVEVFNIPRDLVEGKGGGGEGVIRSHRGKEVGLRPEVTKSHKGLQRVQKGSISGHVERENPFAEISIVRRCGGCYLCHIAPAFPSPSLPMRPAGRRPTTASALHAWMVRWHGEGRGGRGTGLFLACLLPEML